MIKIKNEIFLNKREIIYKFKRALVCQKEWMKKKRKECGRTKKWDA
jgi:hypothetical protein